MARTRFEVNVLLFKYFTVTQEVEVEAVVQELKKHLKKYASNTEISKYSTYKEFDMKVINIEFQKMVSVNTINNILCNMQLSSKIIRMQYDVRYKTMVVRIVLE